MSRLISRVMDAWGAFYQATEQTASAVSGASRLLTGDVSQPRVESWGNAEANRLAASVSYLSGMQGSLSASGLPSERVRGKPGSLLDGLGLKLVNRAYLI